MSPTPFVLHPSAHIEQPSSCDLKCALCIHQLHLAFFLWQVFILHPAICLHILHPSFCIPHPAAFIPHPFCVLADCMPALTSYNCSLHPTSHSLHPACPTWPVDHSYGAVHFILPCSTSHGGSVGLCSHCPAHPSCVYPDTHVGWPWCFSLWWAHRLLDNLRAGWWVCAQLCGS